MLKGFLEYFRLNNRGATLDGDLLRFGDKTIPVVDGIPRFTPSDTYVSGNFSRLREHHATLQLDSKNGTTDRRDTILQRTGWPAGAFAGKTVLECGCGAGPDTEVLLSLGARVVAVDLAGIDVARANIGERPDVCFVQASIMDLPFAYESFDIVFCHRVIMHTPNPRWTLDHILRFVKPGGAVFVHSYARSFQQMFRWKYLLRPLTKRIDAEKLYNFIKAYAPFAYALTSVIRKIPGGKYFNYVCVPFFNYSHVPAFAKWNREKLIEFGVHDTFDALSPAFDDPIPADIMRNIARNWLKRPFEIKEHPSITILRTQIAADQITGMKNVPVKANAA